MLPSLHDDFLVSYEVNCETRQIKLHAKRDPRVPAGNEERANHTIVFNGVEGINSRTIISPILSFLWTLSPSSEFSPSPVRRSHRLFSWRARRILGRLISRPPRKCSRQRACRASF